MVGELVQRAARDVAHDRPQHEGEHHEERARPDEREPRGVERRLRGAVAAAAEPPPEQHGGDLHQDECRPREQFAGEEPFGHVERRRDHPFELRRHVLEQPHGVDAKRAHGRDDHQVAEHAHALRDAGVALDQVGAQQCG